MNFLGFGQSADIEIIFDGAESRKMAEIKTEDGKKEKYLLYYDGETVAGKVNVTLKKPGSKLEHQGIKIELVGQIELYYDRGNHHEFASMVRELARPGDLIQNTSYPFEFANVEKPYEVYVGSNVRLRYFLRVTIVRRLSDIVREIDIAVHTLCSYPEVNSPIKMEVGIEDCLHIEFEYNKSKYHLKDVIVGKIYFLLVRIKIKHMEIAIIKRETTGTGPNSFIENETIAKYEIMDGAPVKGESIPIRVFLAGYDLTPTMRDINKKFSVRYFLNLVLLDTEDRRYFKQQEITLWRKAEKSTRNNNNNKMLTTAQQQQQQMHLHYTFGSSGINNNLQLNEDGSIQRVLSGPTVDPTMGLFTQESPQQETKSEQQSPLSSSSSLNLPKTNEQTKDFSPLNVDNDDTGVTENKSVITTTTDTFLEKKQNINDEPELRKVIKNDDIDDENDDNQVKSLLVSTVIPPTSSSPPPISSSSTSASLKKEIKTKKSSTLFNEDDDNQDVIDENNEKINIINTSGDRIPVTTKKQSSNEKKKIKEHDLPPLMHEPQASD